MLCKVMLNSTDSESRTDLDNEDDINQLDSSGEVLTNLLVTKQNILRVIVIAVLKL